VTPSRSKPESSASRFSTEPLETQEESNHASTNEEPSDDHPRSHAGHTGPARGHRKWWRAVNDACARSPARETDERLFAVAAWRDAPYFTDAERAALSLAEAVTRLSDRPDPVPDEIWNEAARHYDEPALAALILSIATTNVFNRLNVTTRQVAGEWG
jgi:hypothetical protein